MSNYNPSTEGLGTGFTTVRRPQPQEPQPSQTPLSVSTNRPSTTSSGTRSYA